MDTRAQAHTEAVHASAHTFARVRSVPDAWFAAIATTVSLALGTYQLGQPSLWVDESFTAGAVAKPYGQLGSEHHWIYYTLLKPWVASLGHGEIALRLPSVFAAAAACGLLVFLGNRILAPPVGSVAGGIMAVNPFVVQWSQQARSYSLVLLLTLLSTWAFIRMMQTSARRAWGAYTASVGILLLVQPLSAGLLAASQFVAGRGARRRIALAGIVVVVAASPFLVEVASRDMDGGTLKWNDDPTAQSILRAILGLSGALGVGAVLSLVALRCTRRDRRFLAAWAVVPLIVATGTTPIGPVFVDRYLIVSAPAFALLIASTFCVLRRARLFAAVAAFTVGTVVGLAIWYSPDGSQNWRGEDWKAATRYANRHGGADVIPYWALPAFRYYGGLQRDSGLSLVWAEHDAGFAGDWPVDVSFGERLRAQERG